MKENIERIRNRLLKVLHILKSPPPGTALAYGILSLIFVAVVLMTPLHRTPVAYISYALSAVGLCELVVVIVPGVRHIRQKLDEIPAVHRYNTDRLLKARVSLYSSTLFNTGNAGGQGLLKKRLPFAVATRFTADAARQ